MILSKAQIQSCSAEERKAALDGLRKTYNEYLNVLEDLHGMEAAPEVRDLIHEYSAKVDRIRPLLSQSTKVTGAAEEYVPSSGLAGTMEEREARGQKKITVTMANDRKIVTVVNFQNSDGTLRSDEDVHADAKKMAEDIVEFERSNGITRIEGKGRAAPSKSKKLTSSSEERRARIASKKARADDARGLAATSGKSIAHKTGTAQGEDGINDVFTIFSSDGRELPQIEVPRSAGNSDARKIQAIAQAEKFWEDEEPVKEETDKEPVVGVKKPVAEKEKKRPAGFVSGVPDYPEVSGAVGMTASEYRKAVNNYYRKNNILGSLRDTAKRKSANLRKRERAATGEEKFRLQNMRAGVQEKLKSDEADLKARLDKKNVDAEHKRLLEHALKSGARKEYVSREALDYHGISHPYNKERGDSSKEVKLPDSKDVEKIYTQRMPKIKEPPSEVPEEESVAEITERSGKADKSGPRAGQAQEKKFKKEYPDKTAKEIRGLMEAWVDEQGDARGRTSPEAKIVKKFEIWKKKHLDNTLSQHRNDLLNDHGIFPGQATLSDSQKEFVKQLEAAEKKFREDMITKISGGKPPLLGEGENLDDIKTWVRKLRGEGPSRRRVGSLKHVLSRPLGTAGFGLESFRNLSPNNQEYILGLIRKSVDNPLDLRGDITMSGLFLNLCFFKALSLGEDQKIKAFKNSFGRTSGGVNPPTMNTGELEAEEEHEEERKKEKKVKKSLNLYVSC